MSKQVTLTFDRCEDCPYYKSNTKMFAHCNETSIVIEKSYPERRLRNPRQRDFSIPDWCPLEEEK